MYIEVFNMNILKILCASTDKGVQKALKEERDKIENQLLCLKQTLEVLKEEIKIISDPKDFIDSLAFYGAGNYFNRFIKNRKEIPGKITEFSILRKLFEKTLKTHDKLNQQLIEFNIFKETKESKEYKSGECNQNCRCISCYYKRHAILRLADFFFKS